MSHAEDEEDRDVPETSECQRRCDQFARITNSNGALAQMFLQNAGWSVERALDVFYADQLGTASDTGMRNSVPTTSTPIPVRITKRMRFSAEIHSDSSDDIEIVEEKSCAVSLPVDLQSEITSKEIRKLCFHTRFFKIVSWNVDGHEQKALEKRMWAVANEILDEAPDVVFLQELTDESLELINQHLSLYYSSYAPTAGPERREVYFCGMLLSHRMRMLSFRVKPYETTRMGRHLLLMEAEFRPYPQATDEELIDFVLMTSHLESCWDEASERCKQLEFCFGEMYKYFIPLPENGDDSGFVTQKRKGRSQPARTKRDTPMPIGALRRCIETEEKKQYSRDFFLKPNASTASSSAGAGRGLAECDNGTKKRVYVDAEHSVDVLKNMIRRRRRMHVIFGGDFNLREHELSSLGGLPDGVHDLWTITGERPECRYTWDMSRNINHTMPGGGKPRCRFDRIYWYSPPPPPVTPLVIAPVGSVERKMTMVPKFFGLIGLRRPPDCSYYPSDHWGIVSRFELTPAETSGDEDSPMEM